MKSYNTLSYLRVMSLGLGLLLAIKTPLLAQEEGQAQPNKPDARLSRDQLHFVEGYYQNPENSDITIKVKADSVLVAYFLWNGGRIQLHPTSPLEFHSNEGERLSIAFLKGADGKVNGMSIRGGPTWKKVDNYHPIIKNEIAHTPAQLKAYEGLYHLDREPDQYILLREKENKLVLRQQWDGQEVPFVPDSSWDFYCKDNLIFTLHFSRDDNGEVSKVLAFKRDNWIKDKKVNYTPADLKAFEGKYQLSVDSDDLIQVTASGNDLECKQLWDGKTVVVSPLADCYFFNAEQGFPLKFKRDADGKVSQVVGLGNDVFEKVKP